LFFLGGDGGVRLWKVGPHLGGRGAGVTSQNRNAPAVLGTGVCPNGGRLGGPLVPLGALGCPRHCVAELAYLVSLAGLTSHMSIDSENLLMQDHRENERSPIDGESPSKAVRWPRQPRRQRHAQRQPEDAAGGGRSVGIMPRRPSLKGKPKR
jgi:hypothetical protein